MTDIDSTIKRAAKAFSTAAHDLGEALLAKLQRDAPDIAAKAAQSIAAEERMQLLLEFSDSDPKIVWQVVDDYERPKVLITVSARMPTRQ